MTEGIEHTHARIVISESAGNGQAYIDVPERFRGFGDARCEF